RCEPPDAPHASHEALLRVTHSSRRLQPALPGPSAGYGIGDGKQSFPTCSSFFLVPKLCLGTPVAKLCFASDGKQSFPTWIPNQSWGTREARRSPGSTFLNAKKRQPTP